MLLHVIGQTFAAVETLFQLRVREVACDDERASEREASGDGMLRKFGADIRHGTIQVNLHDLLGIGMLTRIGRDEATWVRLQLLNPNTILINLGLGVAVSRTRDREANRTGGPVPGQADDAHVERKPLTSELSADAELVSSLEQLRLKGGVAESTTVLVARSG